MVIVDTSVWIDHLHRADADLVRLLEAGLVRVHPLVEGELACGTIRDRRAFLSDLARLDRAATLTHDEALSLIDRHGLHERGLSIVDVHLLGSALIAGDTIRTRDRSLRKEAERIGVAWPPRPG